MAKKRRAFRYYFQVNLTTIQGRITGGFLAVAFLSVSLIVANDYRWQQVSSLRKQEVTVFTPARTHAMALNKALQQGQSLLYKHDYELNGDGQAQDFAMGLTYLNDTCYQHIAALDTLSQQMEDEASMLFVDSLINHYAQLRLLTDSLVATGPKPMGQIFDRAENLGTLTQHLAQRQAVLLAQTEELYQKRRRRIPLLTTAQTTASVIISAAMATIVLISVLGSIRKLKYHIRSIATGQLPQPLPDTKNELQSISAALNELVENLRNITSFAEDVGKGKFNSNIAVFNNENALGESLANMRGRLQELANEQEQRRWYSEGMNEVSALVRQHASNLEALAQSVVKALKERLSGVQAALYTVENETKGAVITMQGSYAVDRHKFIEARIMPGEGLVGQAFLEAAPVHLREIPEDYIKIESGLGETIPKSILVQPLKYNDKIEGLIELTSLRHFSDDELAFIEAVSEVIGAAIAGLKVNNETRKLLEEAQQNAEAMQAQEEEMRQNAEELEATQEEMRRQVNAANEQQGMYEALLNNMEGIVFRSENDATWTKVYLNETVERLTGYAKEAFLEQGKSFGEVIHPDDLQRVSTESSKGLKANGSYEVAYRLLHKNGTVVKVVEKGRGQYNDQGGLTFIDGIILPQ